MLGDQRAEAAADGAGNEVRASRLRRRLTQKALAERAGISRSQVAKIETGRGAVVPWSDWFAVAAALERTFRVEFARDPLEEPADAGHLEIQQLVIWLGRQNGFDRRVELPNRAGGPTRWTDVALVNQASRRVLLIECVNVFGDIGASFRSSDRKVADAAQLAVALGGDGQPYEVGACWVVRDSARNRELLARYEDLFASRFTGSSRAWLDALNRGLPPPTESGLVWCDATASRLFAWRRGLR